MNEFEKWCNSHFAGLFICGWDRKNVKESWTAAVTCFAQKYRLYQQSGFTPIGCCSRTIEDLLQEEKELGGS